MGRPREPDGRTKGLRWSARRGQTDRHTEREREMGGDRETLNATRGANNDRRRHHDVRVGHPLSALSFLFRSGRAVTKCRWHCRAGRRCAEPETLTPS